MIWRSTGNSPLEQQSWQCRPHFWILLQVKNLLDSWIQGLVTVSGQNPNLVPGCPLPGYAELTLRNENIYAISQPKEGISGLWGNCVIGNLLQNCILRAAAFLLCQMPDHFTWTQAPIWAHAWPLSSRALPHSTYNAPCLPLPVAS